MLRNIKAAFDYMVKSMMRKITILKPELEYTKILWSKHQKKPIRKLERIQTIATKSMPELKEIM